MDPVRSLEILVSTQTGRWCNFAENQDQTFIAYTAFCLKKLDFMFFPFFEILYLFLKCGLDIGETSRFLL